MAHKVLTLASGRAERVASQQSWSGCLARPRTCLHDWPSRDENQLLLIMRAKLRKIGQKQLPLQKKFAKTGCTSA